MTNNLKQNAAKLSALIAQSAKKELQCRQYLKYGLGLILPETANEIRHIDDEQRNFFGSSDYIVSGSFVTGTGELEERAYIYELKAPQCFIFQNDDSNTRLRPTTDLIKAENQLLHYTYEAQRNDTFRLKYSILNADNIRPGGIVIGSGLRKVKGSQNEDEKLRLFDLSKKYACIISMMRTE